MELNSKYDKEKINFNNNSTDRELTSSLLIDEDSEAT